MVWNEQTGDQIGSQPNGRSDQNMNVSDGSHRLMDNFQAMPNIPELSGNPLAIAGRETTDRDVPKETYLSGTGPINPLIPQGQPAVSQTAVSIGSGAQAGLPDGQLPIASQSTARTDDENAKDDTVWVNRAKRIIAGTRGDPHRQVQLLQQLSVVYLKERYGRSVHADEV